MLNQSITDHASPRPVVNDSAAASPPPVLDGSTTTSPSLQVSHSTADDAKVGADGQVGSSSEGTRMLDVNADCITAYCCGKKNEFFVPTGHVYVLKMFSSVRLFYFSLSFFVCYCGIKCC